MGKLSKQSMNTINNGQNQLTIIEDYPTFDEVIEKVTNGMFNVILFGGIPYFLWIFIQFLIMS
ncbi:hypothetical protein ACOI1C_05620 [Bacillus sp. DJP31]|uniref:hypothetical protein n=1 Tax=Bacillus sp. DJP31 TaxID=3409789 RepID=UPI003BB5BDFD